MLSKDVIKKIRSIEIHARRLLSGMYVGDSSSAIKGAGLDFDQIREYQVGDDVRFIDWNSTARMDKLLVRQYIEERSRTIMLAVDGSASTLFSSTNETKFDLMAQIASVLALVASYGKDQVGLIIFTDDVEVVIPPAKGRMHVHRLMEALFNFKPKSKKTSLDCALRYLAAMNRKDSIAFMISDFVDIDYEKSLRVVARRYDLIAIRCLDTREEHMPAVGFLTVSDSETGQLQELDLRKRSSDRVNACLTARGADQDALFLKHGIDFLKVYQDKPFMADIIIFFRRRMRY